MEKLGGVIAMDLRLRNTTSAHDTLANKACSLAEKKTHCFFIFMISYQLELALQVDRYLGCWAETNSLRDCFILDS